MPSHDRIDDPRRALLIRALALGCFATSALPASLAAQVLGRRPGPLPPGRSIWSLDGPVQVNGVAADETTRIRATDLVETGERGRIVFAVGQDAFLLRENSQLQLGGEDNIVVDTLRLITGKLLSAFGRSRHRLSTSTATIGIRGTGVYAEAEPDLSYICTCYGVTEVASTASPDARETITATHHAARYVTADGLRPGPFINHTDEELELIEALVGRTPDFLLGDDAYGAPRRQDY